MLSILTNMKNSEQKHSHIAITYVRLKNKGRNGTECTRKK